MLGTEILSAETIKDISSIVNISMTIGGLSVVLWLRWYILAGGDSAMPESLQGNPRAIAKFRQFIEGTAWIFAAYSLRIGWWVPGLLLAQDGSPYDTFIQSWKWVPYIIADIMFLHGLGRCYDVFVPIRSGAIGWRVRFGFALVLFGWLLTMLAR